MEKVSYVNENNELVSSYFDVDYRPEDNFALALNCTSVLYALARYDLLRDNKSLSYLQDAFRMVLFECKRPHHFIDVHIFLEKTSHIGEVGLEFYEQIKGILANTSKTVAEPSYADGHIIR